LSDGVTLRKFCSKNAGRAIGEAMVRIIEENREMFRSCLNCAHFNEPYRWCGQYQCYPEPRVIVYGCGGYYDKDEIPF
jgi:hypothetical protein